MELLPHGGQHGAPGMEVRTERDPTGAQGLADLLGHTSLLSGEERTCQRPELPRFRAGATPAGGLALAPCSIGGCGWEGGPLSAPITAQTRV